jgi:hypothetical protein
MLQGPDPAQANIAAVASPIFFEGIVCASAIQNRRPKSAANAEFSIMAMELRYKGSVCKDLSFLAF